MVQDRTVTTLLTICTLILIVGALFLARAIIAPIALSIFIIAVASPLQTALERRLPRHLALFVTVGVILALIAVLEYLVIWGFTRHGSIAVALYPSNGLA
jgi:AI-2 transport protein TqsA